MIGGGVSPLVLDLHDLHLDCLSYPSLNQSLGQNSILQILWTDTQFHEIVPSFANFADTLKLGVKQGLEGQTRSQRQGDFMDTSICTRAI